MRAPQEWVPREVRLEAERIMRASGSRGEIARLLITDPRMKQVWRTLQKLPLACSFAELQRYGPFSTATTETDVALAVFLRLCTSYGACENVIDTVGELRQWAKSYQEQAKRLHTEAEEIRNCDYSGMLGAEAQARALDKVAAWCDQEAAMYQEAVTAHAPDSPTIKRDKGWRREMGLAHMIADATQSIYGSPLYNMTATVVTVITKRRQVTKEHVRDWIKLLRRGENKN